MDDSVRKSITAGETQRMRRNVDRHDWMPLIEVTVGGMIAVIGVSAIAGVLISAQSQHDEMSLRNSVLQSAVNLIEEIKAEDPKKLKATFDGRYFKAAAPLKGVASRGAPSTETSPSEDPVKLPQTTETLSTLTESQAIQTDPETEKPAGSYEAYEPAETKEQLEALFNGTTTTLEYPGIETALTDEPILSVAIDDSNPKLLHVTVTAAWLVSGEVRSLTLESGVYNANGN
jgi:Tfp pilus assembly protein PilV